MLATDDIRQTVSSLAVSGCASQQCQAELATLRDSLLDTLESEKVAAFEPNGEWLLNGIRPRPVYAIVRDDGRKLKLAFTGLSSIMVFSSRGRYTHCRPDEFQKRLRKFISG